MEIGLVFQLLKISAEIFQDERRDRFANRILKLEKDYYEELKLPYGERSQLALDNIVLERDILTKNLIDEASKAK